MLMLDACIPRAALAPDFAHSLLGIAEGSA
jgi:hypothetical protein